jgi:DDE superfamily endonuclease
MPTVLSGLFRRRKRVIDVSEAFRRLRACYPRRRLFVIMDNLHNIHDHPRFLALLRRLHVQPVWTPTEASWLNAIEAHFGVTKRATLIGTMSRAGAGSTATSGIAIVASAKRLIPPATPEELLPPSTRPRAPRA